LESWENIEPAISPLLRLENRELPLLVRLLREKFLLNLATIYSVGGSDNEGTIKNKMAAEINPTTGEKVFNFASEYHIVILCFCNAMRNTSYHSKKKTNSGNGIGQLISVALLM
jgi:ferrous iron transport protein B